ncbi:hypothetical protein [Paenibacillus lemnae]|uniref:hypothetical protein n=1 Tax=Paenibacillus lemnae TaxID=1330551 RepID=UPI001FE5F656|nr:hypothetical protein [Paenibacillus lemnae]
MDDYKNIKKPKTTEDIILKSNQIGFDASCDDLLGNFLRMLAASRQQIDILELGTGAHKGSIRYHLCGYMAR